MADRVFTREGTGIIKDKPAKSPTAAFILYYHITFRTKWSRKAFGAEADAERMVDVLKGICQDKGYGLFGVAVMPEHVHVVVSLTPTVAPATAVKNLKGISARLFNKEEGKSGSLWSDGYSVEAVGTKNVWQVLSYVAKQEEHHGLVPG